jgi:UDP-2-acetamido-3-amino-2,3-dideoxy-glucuronate N-acetyltransferase
MIAVIGTGRWGKNWVRVLSELNVLKAVCDKDRSRLDAPETVARFSGEDVVDALCGLNVKGVVIATPAATHYSIAERLLLAGKDVMIEKPMTLSVAEGRDLVDIAHNEGRVLMVGHVLEYHPAVVKLKELVKSGTLGEIRYIYSNRLNMGRMRTEENVLWSFAPHDIAVILSLVGTPEQVLSRGMCHLNNEIADTTMTMMEFAGGVKAHIFVSWLHPFKKQELTVIGDKAMAVFDDTKEYNKLTIYEHELTSGQPVIKSKYHPPYTRAEPLKEEAKDFIRCIKTRERPLVTGEKGVQVLEVLERCRI